MTPEHTLRLGRRAAGRTMAGGQRYQTTGRCSCGAWFARSNEAPSKGGNRAVQHEFRVHLADPAGTANTPSTERLA